MSEFNSGLANRPLRGLETNPIKQEESAAPLQNGVGPSDKKSTNLRDNSGQKRPRSAAPELRIFKPGESAPDIYKFRYQIYEEEMHRNDLYADHSKKIIKDPFDDYAYNIGAFRDGKIVGSIRINFCSDGDPGFYRDFHQLERVGKDYPEKVSFSSRLMVVETERRRLLPLLLSAECFNIAFARKGSWSFLDCNQHLVPFFERMCFEVQNASKIHPSFGDVAIMRVDLSDQRILDKKRSIVARYIRS